LNVLTKASAIPFDCGLRTGVEHGSCRCRGAIFGVLGDEAGAVVGEPFDRLRQHVDAAKAVLDSRDHEVLHILALDAFRGGHMGDCLPVAAIESEGNTDLLLIVAADLEAIGAPSDVRAGDGDLAVMKTIIDGSGMSHEQWMVQLHDPVDALGIGP